MAKQGRWRPALSQSCPLADCGRPAERAEQCDTCLIRCPWCGEFVISQTFGASVDHEFRDDRHLMMGLREFIRAENEQGNSPRLSTQCWQVDAEKHAPNAWGQKPAKPKGE
jgi:hypothetical protein